MQRETGLLAAMRNGERAAFASEANSDAVLLLRAENERKTDLAEAVAAIGILKCRLIKVNEKWVFRVY